MMSQCGSGGVQKESWAASKLKVHLPYWSYLFSCNQGCLGNWKELNSVYHGCAGSVKSDDTQCRTKFEWIDGSTKKNLASQTLFKVATDFKNFNLQVRVDVYICYSSGDRCNKGDMTAGASRQEELQLSYISILTFSILVISRMY